MLVCYGLNWIKMLLILVVMYFMIVFVFSNCLDLNVLEILCLFFCFSYFVNFVIGCIILKLNFFIGVFYLCLDKILVERCNDKFGKEKWSIFCFINLCENVILNVDWLFWVEIVFR